MELQSQISQTYHAGRNIFDACLAQEKNLWDLIMAEGLSAVCCPQGRPPYHTRPFINMPDSGRRFKEIGSFLVSNGTFDGSSNIVLQFQVPIGYDGVIDTVICGLSAASGSGFVEGSGTIIWRLAADAASVPRYLRNLGNIQFSLGSLTVPIPTPNSSLRVYSGDLVTFFVALEPSGSGVINTDAIVVCALSGWFYSR